MLPPEGAVRRGGFAPLRLPPPGAPAVVQREARASPYLSARLSVVIEPVELWPHRVRLRVDLTILAQVASALLRTRT